MKLYFKIGIPLLIGMIAIQFFRPDKNIQEKSTDNDFLIAEKAPKDVKKLYVKACYDCHSNYTHYKWFDHIAPISWYVDNKIKAGKYNLNFSTWKKTASINKEIMFQAILFDITSSSMPKEDYLKWHPDSQLTPEEKIKMTDWLQTVKKRFLLNEGQKH